MTPIATRRPFRQGDPSLDVWDLERLGPVVERTHGPEIVGTQCKLTATADPLVVGMPESARLCVALVRAQELVALPGVDDMTIFDPNVRLSVGSTRINRELQASIQDLAEHPLFAAYHNGMTMLTDRLRISGRSISLDGIGVVNGCQSLVALWKDRDSLTPALTVLVKIVQVGDQHGLGDRISYTANNQNPINMRDLRSNDRIQRDLMGQVEAKYGDRFTYLIKQGQDRGQGDVLDNQTAAQLITAIWPRNLGTQFARCACLMTTTTWCSAAISMPTSSSLPP